MPLPTTDTTPPPAAPAAGAPDEALDPTLSLLYSAIEDTPPKTPTPPTPDPTDPATAAPAAPATPDPAKPPTPDGKIKVRKKKPAEPAAPATPPAAPAAPAPAAAAPTPPPKDENAQFEADLLDEEREQLEYAREAERLLPDKFKGQEGKVKKFLKDHQAYLEKAKAADPDVVFDASNAEYQAFLAKNNPIISPRQVREIERLRAAEEADKRFDPKLNEIREEMFRREEEPKVKAETDRFFAELADSGLPDELKATLKEKGAAEAAKLHPIEYKVANLVMSEAAKSMEEFIAITRVNPVTGKPLKAYDSNNERHQKLLEFINLQCDMFKTGGGDLRVRDGKQFLTRKEFFNLPTEQRAKYWTFTNNDVIAMAKVAAKESIRSRIEAEYKHRESEGWSRPQKAPTAAATPPPAGAPPAPRASQIPAGGNPGDDKPGSEIDLLMGKTVA